jgi:ribosomal protein L19E
LELGVPVDGCSEKNMTNNLIPPTYYNNDMKKKQTNTKTDHRARTDHVRSKDDNSQGEHQVKGTKEDYGMTGFWF